MPTIFRYKPFRRRLAPIITIGMKVEATWYPIEVYVDSGSVYTILHARIAEGIGFDYLTGERTYLQVGDGSFIPVYLHELPIQVGDGAVYCEDRVLGEVGRCFQLVGKGECF